MAFAETFKALSDPVRREILQLLKKGKMSVGEIGGHFDMTGATISYHLKILKLILEECDLAVFYDNTEKFKRFAIYKEGKLVRLSQTIPKWFQM